MPEELDKRGWTEEDLQRRRKGDPEKLAIAARLRKETILSIKEITDLVRLRKYTSRKRQLV